MKKLFFLMGSLYLCHMAQAQNQPTNVVKIDTTDVIPLEEVMVKGVRVKKTSPVTFSNITKEQIKNRNLGQDIPIMLNYLPNVVTTSDAGAGVGYTGIRVRGSDATRVNITINGIPYNDSESQATFLVNIPDFVSSVESLQLQRGLGTSTNGTAAFGASLNMLTDNSTQNGYAEISNSYGSFNTRKHTVKLGTGRLNNHFEVSGRLSKISSDGYIDRATSDLKSYFLQGTYFDKNTVIKALVFGGKEKTYQAWNGIDSHQLGENRRYNPSGKYTANGKTHFYDNETDNYKQDHYQLHWNQQYTANWSSHIGLHYTKGKGYYENYKTDRYSDYGLMPLPEIEEDGKKKERKAGLIRQKWLDNDFYGTVFSFNYEDRDLDFILGGGVNNYEGAHFGNILWTEVPTPFQHQQEYYRDNAKKLDANIYTKATYKLNTKWQLFGDLQYRFVNYTMSKKNINEDLNFFNPKAGITYFSSLNNSFYFSYARGHREPNRDDYEDNEVLPKPEELNDFELGWRYLSNRVKINTNLYYMLYQNQLVLTGALNDVGSAIRANSGKSYRLGLELDAVLLISNQWQLRPNFAISSNKNIDFYEDTSDGKSKNVGNTDISYSPNFIAGNILTYAPLSNFQISLLSKYVGDQYMSNLNEKDSKLNSYFVNDLNIAWQIHPKDLFKSVEINLLVNNILNEKYVSNGWFGWGDAGYYPQAEINFLAGLTLRF